MKITFLSVLISLILMSSTPASAQSSNLWMGQSNGFPGIPVVTRIYIDHTVECEAFSFGVAHDPTVLSISTMQNGFYLVGSNLGGVSPEFLMMEANPINGGGFIVGCLVDLTEPINPLIAGVGQEIVVVTYDVAATATPGSTPLQFSSDLHDPAVEMLVVMNGLEYMPTWVDGSVNILADCNGNGIEDSVDLASGTSSDCDLNGVPDSCDIAAGGDQDGNGVLDTCENALFWRGDCNNSGSLDLADAIASLYYLFGLANLVTCIDSCDVNDSGAVDIADTVYFLGGLFSNGPLPFAPYPACGFDPTADPLGCASFQSACP
ncbi:MAG: hypothetical protein OSB09_06440 [Planctomycetota bacterium]|nr:hypothetical protein [Planctomycetota bacterium]